MERFHSEILGTPVVTEQTGKTVGRVLDVVVDPDSGEVVALSLDPGHRKIIVPIDIHAWFQEVVIPDPDALIHPEEVIRVSRILEEDRFILKKKVYTKSGEYLGKVVDFAVHIEQMFMTKILVASSFLNMVRFQQMLISFQNIIEITPEKVVVKDNTERIKEKKEARELTAEVA